MLVSLSLLRTSVPLVVPPVASPFADGRRRVFAVRRNKGAALVNLSEAPSSPLHVRMQLDKPALVQRAASFYIHSPENKGFIIVIGIQATSYRRRDNITY